MTLVVSCWRRLGCSSERVGGSPGLCAVGRWAPGSSGTEGRAPGAGPRRQRSQVSSGAGALPRSGLCRRICELERCPGMGSGLEVGSWCSLRGCSDFGTEITKLIPTTWRKGQDGRCVPGQCVVLLGLKHFLLPARVPAAPLYPRQAWGNRRQQLDSTQDICAPDLVAPASFPHFPGPLWLGDPSTFLLISCSVDFPL